MTVATKDTSHPYYGVGSSNGYKLNGTFSPFLRLIPRNTYRFDQSDSSNSGHPLRFYYEADKSTAYTSGVTTSGTPNSSGAYTQILQMKIHLIFFIINVLHTHTWVSVFSLQQEILQDLPQMI